MTAGACFFDMGIMAEPAVVHIAIGLGHWRDAIIDPPARCRRGNAMTVETGSAAREHLADRQIGPARAELDGTGIVAGDAGLVVSPRTAARHPAKIDRASRPGRTIISAQIGLNHRRFAVSQRPHRAADLVKGETVAHAAIFLHVDRFKAHALGIGCVAILARERGSKTIFC